MTSSLRRFGATFAAVRTAALPAACAPPGSGGSGSSGTGDGHPIVAAVDR